MWGNKLKISHNMGVLRYLECLLDGYESISFIYLVQKIVLLLTGSNFQL